MLNIGSHVGLEAIIFGKIIGEKGRIFIFEPYSLSFNILLKNIYLNNIENIATAYNIGAGNTKTEGTISVSTANTGGSKIYTN